MARAPIEQWDFYKITGPTRSTYLPPGLNTSFPQTEITTAETPECYGMTITNDGRISKGVTAPTGSERILREIIIDNIPYYWAFERLWNINGLQTIDSGTSSSESEVSSSSSETRPYNRNCNELVYGAKYYDDIFVDHNLSKITFQETQTCLVTIMPVANTGMLVIKSDGSYFLNGCGGNAPFNRSDIITELRASDESRVTELDGIVYVSNSDGLFSFKGGKTEEVSRKVRNSSTIFKDCDLTIDSENKYIIGNDGTNTYTYEVPTDKIYMHDGTNFRYTSPQLHTPDYRTMSIPKIFFTIEHADTSGGWIKYQSRVEDQNWGTENTIAIPYASEKYTVIGENLENDTACYRFQYRLTDMSTNIYIKEARVDREAFSSEDYVV